MHLNKINKIAIMTLQELIRRKFLYILLFFGLAIIVFSYFANFFGLGAQSHITKDFSLAGIGFFGIVLTISLMLTLIPNEIEKKTIYPLLTKPISRFDYLMGKTLGVLLLVALNLLVLSLLLVIIMLYKDGVFYGGIFEAVFLSFIECVVICFIVSLLSVLVSPAINISLVIFIYFLGHLSQTYVSYLAGLSQNQLLNIPLMFIKVILPQLEYFNIKEAIVWDYSISWVYVAEAAVYGILYSLFLLLLSYLFFEKKDL